MSEVVGPRWEVVVDHTEERHALDAYPIVRTVIQSRLSHAQQVARRSPPRWRSSAARLAASSCWCADATP